jgi:hypothetical protein
MQFGASPIQKPGDGQGLSSGSPEARRTPTDDLPPIFLFFANDLDPVGMTNSDAEDARTSTRSIRSGWDRRDI